MPTTATYNKVTPFLQQLTEQLKRLGDVLVQRDPLENGINLLVIDPQSGKRIAIECKDAGDYGELPIAAILPIARLVRNNPDQQVILVSFSNISDLLSTGLKELNVQALTEPTVEKVVHQVQFALSA